MAENQKMISVPSIPCDELMSELKAMDKIGFIPKETYNTVAKLLYEKGDSYHARNVILDLKTKIGNKEYRVTHDLEDMMKSTQATLGIILASIAAINKTQKDMLTLDRVEFALSPLKFYPTDTYTKMHDMYCEARHYSEQCAICNEIYLHLQNIPYISVTAPEQEAKQK